MNPATIKLDVECATCGGDGCYDDNDQSSGNPDCEEGLVKVEFPAKFAVCSRCEGKGSHINPSIDGHGITAEEWDRDWDDESRENYFSGVYDVTCGECKGLRVVPVVDEERLNEEAKAQFAKAEERTAQVSRWNYEDAQTRRMESGGAW